MRGFGLLALLTGLFFAATTRGAIIFQSGLVRAAASSSIGSSSTPPDAIMPPSGAVTSNSASVFDPSLGDASASGSASFGTTSSFSAQVFLSINAFLGYTASASVSAPITFQETTTQTLAGSLSIFSGTHGNGNLVVKDSSNFTLMILGVNPSTLSAQGQVTLTPGIYTLTWGAGPQAVVGTGGGASISGSFGTVVPEPASISSLALGSLLMCRRLRTGRQYRRG